MMSAYSMILLFDEGRKWKLTIDDVIEVFRLLKVEQCFSLTTYRTPYYWDNFETDEAIEIFQGYGLTIDECRMHLLNPDVNTFSLGIMTELTNQIFDDLQPISNEFDASFVPTAISITVGDFTKLIMDEVVQLQFCLSLHGNGVVSENRYSEYIIRICKTNVIMELIMQLEKLSSANIVVRLTVS